MRHSSIIAPEGLPVSAAAVSAASVCWVLGWHKAAAVFSALSVFAVWFFRNPERHMPQGEGLIVSPADGRVIFAGEVDEGRYLNARAVKVSIFMNLLDVHVNRAPLSGVVTGIHYNKGKFYSADKDKASLDNEQNAVVLDTPGGRLMFVQIAGLVARRIVCWVRPGDAVTRGERVGLIMFGSRLDVYMPARAVLKVAVGERAVAGETVIGVLP